MPSHIGTREQILSAALDLFLAKGYEASSLREIAEQLDMTKAALYYHFPAKEQLIVELTRPFLNDLADLVASARALHSEDRLVRRVELLSNYLDVLTHHQRIVSVLAQNPAALHHPDVGLRARNLIDAYTAELAGPESSGDDQLRVACAIGAVSAATSAAASDPVKKKSVILGAALAAMDAPVVSDPLPVAAVRLREVVGGPNDRSDESSGLPQRRGAKRGRST